MRRPPPSPPPVRPVRTGPLLTPRGRQWVAVILTAAAALALAILCGNPS